jgi:acyl CoA:acetate/3-ketoacid CoA transferase alpha subunit/acyl CoA:acetate/3-ketoacid CoA transferase beta subunit
MNPMTSSPAPLPASPEPAPHAGAKQLTLEEAVARHVRPGDSICISLGHSRWTAAAREVARRHWGTDAGFTLVMLSLSSLGTLFFRGGMVTKVVTAYSGDSFPTYTPNPVFQQAYRAGTVEVEHWSILTYVQRLEAAARGLPAVVTGSLVGSSMADNQDFAVVDSPFGTGAGGAPGTLGLVSPLAPDITLLHGAVADEQGNVVVSAPGLEGHWAGWAAKRGVIATVEKIVPSLDGLGHRVNIPAHRVLAVVEAPFGAHPGGVYAPGLPCRGYGEDVPFWTEARDATRSDLDAWAQKWVLGPATHDEYLALLGDERLRHLESRSDPHSWRSDQEAHPVDTTSPPTAAERAAVHAVRELRRVVAQTGADAVLAGAGVANLAAWVAVAQCRAEGSAVGLTAELGMLGYTPTPADPYIFNQRVFPHTSSLSDAQTVLGMVVGGPGTTVVGCLGAAQVDREGNLNSTDIPGGPFLVGSGGANDVASRAASCVVVVMAGTHRLVERAGYVTSPGRNVEVVATDLGVLRKRDGVLRLEAVPTGEEPVAERVKRFVAACGWDVSVARELEELDPPTPDEVLALRSYDPEGLFLN